MIDSFKLQRYDTVQAQKLLDDLVAVYLAIYDDPSDEFHTEDRFRRQLTGHMQVPGWTLVTAAVGDELVGYIYGFPLPPSTRWWQGLRTPVPDGFTDEDGHRTFALSELLVRTEWRRRGVAHALHDELINSRSEQRATLLVRSGNTPAQKAYTRWGYQTVAKLRPAWEEHTPTFDVLILMTRPGDRDRQ